MEQTAVMFEWPFDAEPRRAIRFFASVGHFHVSQRGDVFVVRDDRKANHRGGPDDGVRFATMEEVEEFVKGEE